MHEYCLLPYMVILMHHNIKNSSGIGEKSLGRWLVIQNIFLLCQYGEEKEDFQGFLSAYRLFCFVSGFKMFKQVVIGSCGGLTRFNSEVHPTWLLSSKVSAQEKHDHTVTPSNCFYTVTVQFTLSNSLGPRFIFNKHSNPKLLKYFSSGGTCIFWIIQQLLKSNHSDRLHMACWAITSCFTHPFSLFLFPDIFLTTLPNIYWEIYLGILRSFKSIISQGSKANEQKE